MSRRWADRAAAVLSASVLLLLGVGCGDDDGDVGATDGGLLVDGSDDVADSTSGAVDDTIGDDAVRKVTVGVFLDDGSGGYVDSGRTLVFEVGVPCATWHRTTDRSDGHGDGPHEHYNAADDTTYVAGSLTWTEYGPEATATEAEATCAAGTQGAVKSIDGTDYTADKSFFLRIVSVE